MNLLVNVGLLPDKQALMDRLDSLPPVCPVRIFLGLKCAFCGMTHAFIHLLYLDVREAFAANALSIPLAMGLLLWPLIWKFRSRQAALWGLLVLSGYAVLRNLPL